MAVTLKKILVLATNVVLTTQWMLCVSSVYGCLCGLNGFAPVFPENSPQYSAVMQQVENGREEEATVDVQFTELPNALIACKVQEDLFNEGSLRVSVCAHICRHCFC